MTPLEWVAWTFAAGITVATAFIVLAIVTGCIAAIQDTTHNRSAR